jgi:hypothetical protein
MFVAWYGRAGILAGILARLWGKNVDCWASNIISNHPDIHLNLLDGLCFH